MSLTPDLSGMPDQHANQLVEWGVLKLGLTKHVQVWGKGQRIWKQACVIMVKVVLALSEFRASDKDTQLKLAFNYKYSEIKM